MKHTGGSLPPTGYETGPARPGNLIASRPSTHVSEILRLGSNHRPMALPAAGDVELYSDMTLTRSVAETISVHAGGALVLLGVAEGGVVVTGGGFARIPGKTSGLFVAAGGHAVLTGICEGDAVNDGGELVIEGTVTGKLVELAGTTKVAPGGRVGASGA